MVSEPYAPFVDTITAKEKNCYYALNNSRERCCISIHNDQSAVERCNTVKRKLERTVTPRMTAKGNAVDTDKKIRFYLCK